MLSVFIDGIRRWARLMDALIFLTIGKNLGDPPRNRTENRLIKSQLLCLVELTGLAHRL